MDKPGISVKKPLPDLSVPHSSGYLSAAAVRFEEILAPYDEAMALMAEFERIEHSDDPVDMDAIKGLYDRLQLSAQKLIVALGDLGDHRSDDLLKAHQQFARQMTPLFEPALSLPSHPILVSLEDIHKDMTPLVGHKAAHLAVISNETGLPVPEGFVLTAKAFDRFMQENELPGLIEAYLRDLTIDDPRLIHERCEAIRRLILQSPIPRDVEEATRGRLDQWRKAQGRPVFSAVRSTAIGEDSEVSFAGQFATLLNVPAKSVPDAYKEVLASKYNPRAILYRMRYGLDDQATPMAVMVMAMIPARASGVVYTRNPSLPDQDDLQISAIRGLGEYLMSGDIAPLVLSVRRRTGHITTRHIAHQSHWITPLPDGGTRLERLPPMEASQTPLDNASINCLADWGQRLEKHFGSPQDVEWAMDRDARLYLLQSRSLGLDGLPPSEPANFISLESLPVLHSGGRKACSGIVTGRIYRADQDMSDTIPADSILVIPKAAPEYSSTVARIRGVIATKGSAASHLASVAREFGVPMIVDTGTEVDQWVQGQWVTLYADKVTVYAGRMPTLEGGPSRRRSDPFETPIRRRLRALSNRITPCQHPSPGETSLAAEKPFTMHDLVWQAHGCALETLVARRQASEASLEAIHWTRDNAAADFKLPSGPSDASRPSVDQAAPQGHVGRQLLQALWDGLSRADGRPTADQPLGTDGYALMADRSLCVSLTIGSRHAIIDAGQLPGQNSCRIRLRFVGGAGPYYKRCLQTRFLAGVLAEFGFSLQINGTLLDACRIPEGRPDHCRLMRRIGGLLIFNHRMDAALVGPWVLEDLQNTFMTSSPLSPHTTADLPSAFSALSGHWRQATLNNRAVVVQDGASVGTVPVAPLHQSVGPASEAYQAFLHQLYRDHYFPLAIARESHFKDGQIDLTINLLAGQYACAGGIAFGFLDGNHYFMLGLDAHHEHVILSECINGRRFKRLRKRYPVDTDRWYDITLRISGLTVNVQINGVPVMAYIADCPISGQIGMWAWADTVIIFDGLALMSGTRQELGF
jgi:pyruvate,water dikinase